MRFTTSSWSETKYDLAIESGNDTLQLIAAERRELESVFENGDLLVVWRGDVVYPATRVCGGARARELEE